VLTLAQLRPTATDVERCVDLLATEADMDWGRFLELTLCHRVAALVIKNLRDFGLDSFCPYRQQLPSLYLYNQIRNEHLAEEFRHVARALYATGVRVVVRKGFYLAERAYAQIGLRYFSDFDFLVGPSDISVTTRTLEELGYRQGLFAPNRRTLDSLERSTDIFWRLNVGALPPFRRLTSDPYVDVLKIDLRTDLLGGGRLAVTPLIASALEEDVVGIPVLVLTPEDAILDLALHLHREATSLVYINDGDDLTLSKFLDLAEYWRAVSARLDVEKLAQRIAEFAVPREFFYALFFSNLVYPGRISRAHLEQFTLEDVGYLDEYGEADHAKARWADTFWTRLFDPKRHRTVQEKSRLPRA
jgi:hypothetical protein